jgi:hypothetical protein
MIKFFLPGLMAFVIAIGGAADAARLPTPQEIQRNVQEGFSATAHFEIVRGENVPDLKKNQTTYRLDPDKDAYEATYEGLAHIQWVTLAWGENPFLFDLYLHGDAKTPERLAIRVANLDIRKFFHPSIASFSTNRNLTRLQAYFEEFSRKAKIIYALPDQQTGAQKISDLVLINNCREPGNYEIKVRDALGRYLLEANFSFSTQAYNQLLIRFHGIGIREQGTGIGVPWTLQKKEGLRYWDSFLPWNRIKRFPKVSLDDLSQIHGNEVSRVRGEIEPVYGRIPFEEYEADREVQMKSRPHWLGNEPLTYVRVDPKLPLPIGFEPPAGSKPAGFLPGKTAPMVYWTAKENRGKIVPHHFRTFEDVQRYNLFFSAFTLNGVYIGKSDLADDFNRERTKGRWPFDFRYLNGINRFEIRQWEGGTSEIRLLSETTGSRTINFALGNFRLGAGESVEFLFGLDTQPLITDYNNNPLQDPLRYAVAYDADGTILDHHDRGIGVEKVFIERTNEKTYKVRLISYERILPVWEGVIRVLEELTTLKPGHQTRPN